MIGAEHDERVGQAHAVVDRLEQFLQHRVESQELVHDLLALRSVGVPNDICRGEPDSKDIGMLILPELVCLHRLQRD